MPRRKRFLRRKLKINEVSLCGDPANPDARIAFHKSEDPTMTIALEKYVDPDETGIDLSELPQDVRNKILKVLDEAGYVFEAQPIDKSNMSDAARAQVEAVEKSNEKMRKEAEVAAKRIVELKVKAASAGGRVNGLNLEALRRQIPAEVVKAISEITKDEGDMPKRTVPISKAIVFAACQMRARELYPDDHPDVAAGKFFQTPDGFKARKAMEKLPGPYQEADTAPVEKTAGDLEAELPAMRKLTEAAQKIRIENPEMTREQSFVRAIKIDSDAYKQYRLEKRALVKKLDPNLDEG